MKKVRTQRMYFLKKLHKTPHGIRPIVSGCSEPTEHVSSFLDHIIKPLVPTMPSYIKDSPHLISLLENTHIPRNAILVKIDVPSLYMNIPQDEGMIVCLDAIEAAKASHIPRNALRQLFDIALSATSSASTARSTSWSRVQHWGQRWLLHMLICSLTDLNKPGRVTQMTSYAFGHLQGREVQCNKPPRYTCKHTPTNTF